MIITLQCHVKGNRDSLEIMILEPPRFFFFFLFLFFILCLLFTFYLFKPLLKGIHKKLYICFNGILS